MAKIQLSTWTPTERPIPGMLVIVSSWRTATALLCKQVVAAFSGQFDRVVYCGEDDYFKPRGAVTKCAEIADVACITRFPGHKRHIVVFENVAEVSNQEFDEWRESHRDVLVIVLLRNVAHLTDYVRSNASLVFFAREISLRQKRRIYVAFKDFFVSFNQLCQVIKKCTWNLDNAMVLQLDAVGHSITQRVFRFRPEQTDYTEEKDEGWDPEQAFSFLALWSPKWIPEIPLLIREWKNWKRQGGGRIEVTLAPETLHLRLKRRHAPITWGDGFEEYGYTYPWVQSGYGPVRETALNTRDRKMALEENVFRGLDMEEEVEFDGKALRISRFGSHFRTDQEVTVTQDGIQQFGMVVFGDLDEEDTLAVKLERFREQILRRVRRRVAVPFLDEVCRIPTVLCEIVKQYI